MKYSNNLTRSLDHLDEHDKVLEDIKIKRDQDEKLYNGKDSRF